MSKQQSASYILRSDLATQRVECHPAGDLSLVRREGYQHSETAHYDLLINSKNQVVGFVLCVGGNHEIFDSAMAKMDNANSLDGTIEILLSSAESPAVHEYQGFAELYRNSRGEYVVEIVDINLWEEFAIGF